MGRFLVPVKTEQVCGIDLATFEERISCDNPDCPLYGVIAGIPLREPNHWFEAEVVRYGDEYFCSEECYLQTPEAKARMELTNSEIDDKKIPHLDTKDDKKFINYMRPSDLRKSFPQ